MRPGEDFDPLMSYKHRECTLHFTAIDWFTREIHVMVEQPQGHFIPDTYTITEWLNICENDRENVYRVPSPGGVDDE